ncbi:MAG: disulfide isomerase DsbC N-terminal domain-containing protein [Candidatus Methylumidiphilus sp.]
MRPRLLIIILLSVLTGHSIADTNPSSPSVTDTADLLSNANIEGLKALPIHGLNMVKAGGKTFFMSDNGRFVITGTLLDVWNRVAVTELDQVDQIANRIDLSSMKLKIDDLGPATVGTGKAQVVVFVDPRCPY